MGAIEKFELLKENTLKMVDLAPVVLFVYNRPWHTKQTIEALLRNTLADKSELFIYSDAAKSSKDQAVVQEVRGYICSISGFKKVEIIERNKNWGLADSIIDGVTTIVNKHGKVIVLEDDLVTSPFFLKFMNDALVCYEHIDRIMHISGWNYPINSAEVDDVFLWRLMNCWGWATWKNAWGYFSKNPIKLMKSFSSADVQYLNLDGDIGSWSEVQANIDERINTWAIFWYASIIKRRGLCLNPTFSLVDNIGLDGSGINCGSNVKFKNKLCERMVLLPRNLDEVENQNVTDEIRRFMKMSFLKKLKNLFHSVKEFLK